MSEGKKPFYLLYADDPLYCVGDRFFIDNNNKIIKETSGDTGGFKIKKFSNLTDECTLFTPQKDGTIQMQLVDKVGKVDWKKGYLHRGVTDATAPKIKQDAGTSVEYIDWKFATTGSTAFRYGDTCSVPAFVKTPTLTKDSPDFDFIANALLYDTCGEDTDKKRRYIIKPPPSALEQAADTVKSYKDKFNKWFDEQSKWVRWGLKILLVLIIIRILFVMIRKVIR
jgi:hypothetical protein